MKLAVLDLDGTLVDSKLRHRVTLDYVLANINFVFDSKIILLKAEKRINIDAMIARNLKRRILEFPHNYNIVNFVDYKSDGYTTKDFLINELKFDDNKASIINETWINLIENNYLMGFDTWYKDSEEFISSLKNKGYDIAILTARNNTLFTERFIKNSSIYELINEVKIVSPKEAASSKNEYLKEKSANYDKIIIVGDTEVDYKAAIDSNNDYYLLNSGFRSKAFWDKKQIKSYDSLEDILKMIP